MSAQELAEHIIMFLRGHQGKHWREIQGLLAIELVRIGATATKVTVE